MYSTYRSLLPRSAELVDGRLQIAGVDLRSLAERHGTPLVVYDERHLRESAREYVDAFADYPGEAQVAYACKAWCAVPLLRLFAELGLGADVASGGELAIALAAGVAPDRLVVHGNNKSRAELQVAVEAGAGLIVVDAEHELDLLEDVAREAGVRQQILVRVTPGIDAETHHYIRTAHTGSKFGVEPEVGLALLARAAASEWLQPRGVHVHLGSQLLDLGPWRMAVDWLAMYLRRAREAGVELDTVDVGGGLGIRYTEHQQPPTVAELAREVIALMGQAWRALDMPLPRLIVEPGRSIVGQAALTLYEVGPVKRAGGVHYVNVDGGMSDNIRPMLYQAEYRCLLPERADVAPSADYWVAGKHCESGDILIEDAPLPDPQPGDLLAVLATGAYTLAMGSNYNALLRPPVVFVRDGEERLVVRRETLDDLFARDVEHDAVGVVGR